MSQSTLKYLQQDQVGKVIAKGLASLYTHKPQKPVKYLAEWLKNYSHNQKQLSRVVQAQNDKKQSLKHFDQANQLQKQVQLKQQAKIDERQNKIQQFKKMVAQHQYQQQLLEQILPQFVQKFTKITGAYIGELNHPPKQVTDQDNDQFAHLNTGADKVINYIGSGVSHKNLMRGKILKLSEGVTAKAFELAEEVPPAAEEGQEAAPQPREKYTYVPNVVKNQSVHYFRIPKLGAYLAVPLVYNSYLAQKIFDEALAAKNKQLQEIDQFNAKKKEELQQLQKNREQLQRKIGDLADKNNDQAQLQSLNAQLSQLVTKIQQKTAEEYKKQDPALSLIKNSYVLCVDNLGKDQQLDKNDIDLIVDLTEHFKNSWQAKQKQLLDKDVITQIQFLKTLPNTVEQIKDELQKQSQIDEQGTKIINETEDQKLKAYRQQDQQLKAFRNAIQNNKLYLNCFLKIKQFRVVKFKEVIQNILLFLGQSKQHINISKRASLNWKYVKANLITQQTFNRILNYLVQGPKQDKFNSYSKTPYLLETFQKFNEDQIFAYNVGLGALVRFIKKALKHRVSNVELRKTQKQVEREQRKALIEQNEKIETEKQRALETHKVNLAPEEVETFKQEQWIERYEAEHPTKEVPPEIVDDVDNDM